MYIFKQIIVLLSLFILVVNAQTQSNFELRTQAQIAYKEGYLYKALNLLNQALMNDSTDALAFFNLANVYLSVPHRERAIKNFKRSINLNPSNIELMSDQFIVYSGLSKRLDNISNSFISKSSDTDSTRDSTYNLIVLKYMNKDSLDKILRAYLKNNLNIPMYVDYFLWLKSPIASKLSQQHQLTNDSLISTDKISVNRVKLFLELDNVLGATKSTYKKVSDVGNILSTFSKSDSVEDSFDPSGIDTTLWSTLENNTVRQYVINFQHFEDCEIKELITFYKSGLGRCLAKIGNESIEFVMKNANSNVLKNLLK